MKRIKSTQYISTGLLESINKEIIDKQKEKIKKLNNLIQNKQRKNDKLASEIKDTQSESRKVDYLQLYKKEKIDFLFSI